MSVGNRASDKSTGRGAWRCVLVAAATATVVVLTFEALEQRGRGDTGKPGKQHQTAVAGAAERSSSATRPPRGEELWPLVMHREQSRKRAADVRGEYRINRPTLLEELDGSQQAGDGVHPTAAAGEGEPGTAGGLARSSSTLTPCRNHATR